jgi:hypothetical protein
MRLVAASAAGLRYWLLFPHAIHSLASKSNTLSAERENRSRRKLISAQTLKRFPRQPLGLQPSAICMKRPLSLFMLAHGLCGVGSPRRISGFALGGG